MSSAAVCHWTPALISRDGSDYGEHVVERPSERVGREPMSQSPSYVQLSSRCAYRLFENSSGSRWKPTPAHAALRRSQSPSVLFHILRERIKPDKSLRLFIIRLKRSIPGIKLAVSGAGLKSRESNRFLASDGEGQRPLPPMHDL